MVLLEELTLTLISFVELGQRRVHRTKAFGQLSRSVPLSREGDLNAGLQFKSHGVMSAALA